MSNNLQGLGGLLRLLTDSPEGLQQYVYNCLEAGDVWWIPDSASSLKKARHPWVIVRGYAPLRPMVTACLRTSSRTNRGIFTPANILPGLEREGVIVPQVRKVFNAIEFRDYEYIGRLSEEWIQKIQGFYRDKHR